MTLWLVPAVALAGGLGDAVGRPGAGLGGHLGQPRGQGQAPGFLALQAQQAHQGLALGQGLAAGLGVSEAGFDFSGLVHAGLGQAEVAGGLHAAGQFTGRGRGALHVAEVAHALRSGDRMDPLHAHALHLGQHLAGQLPLLGFDAAGGGGVAQGPGQQVEQAEGDGAAELHLVALAQALQREAQQPGPGGGAGAGLLGLALRQQGAQGGAALQRQAHGLVLRERAFGHGRWRRVGVRPIGRGRRGPGQLQAGPCGGGRGRWLRAWRGRSSGQAIAQGLFGGVVGGRGEGGAGAQPQQHAAPQEGEGAVGHGGWAASCGDITWRERGHGRVPTEGRGHCGACAWQRWRRGMGRAPSRWCLQARGGLNRPSVPWRPVSLAGVQPGALPGGTAAPDQSHIGGGSTPAWQRSHKLQPWCGVWVAESPLAGAWAEVAADDVISSDGASACAWQGGVASARTVCVCVCVGARVSAPASATDATAVCTAMPAHAQLRTGSSATIRHNTTARHHARGMDAAVERAGAA